MSIEVKWRNGKRSVVQKGAANRIYEIDETAAQASIEAPKAEPKPLFEETSNALGHAHRENEFNDFDRQPLLPRKLSQLGPGVAWADLDGDGFEDLIIGSGNGGELAVYHNDGKGGLKRLTGTA